MSSSQFVASEAVSPPVSQPSLQRVTEIAEGDGNCAFNAFTLGLSEARILDHLPECGEPNPDQRFAEFIKRAQTVFTGTPLNWQILRNALIRHKEKNPVDLQKALAPVMRTFALDLIRQNKEAYYDSTVNVLQDELESYFKIMTNRFDGKDKSRAPITFDTPGMGDIFIRHQFVQESFAWLWQNYGKLKTIHNQLKFTDKEATEAKIMEAFAESDKELQETIPKAMEANLLEAKKMLAEKWKKKGIDMFLDSMNNHAVYAGDLELAPLAQYFGVALEVNMGKRGGLHDIVHGIGLVKRMPESLKLEDNAEFKLDRATCIKLSLRGIIDVERNLEPISAAEVDVALGEIPDCAVVTKYINDNQPVKGAPVPKEWSVECIQQLRKRGVTRSSGNDHVFVSDLSDAYVTSSNSGKANRAATLERIAAFPHAKEIAAAWKAVPDAPKITLANKSATHWNNITLKEVVVPAFNLGNFDLGHFDFADSDDEAGNDDGAANHAGNNGAANNAGAGDAKNSGTATGNNNAATKPVVVDSRAALTKLFLKNSTSVAMIDDVLSCRTKLDENHADIKKASESLFSYANTIKRPQNNNDRYAFAVRYHAMLGLSKWAEYCVNRPVNSAEKVAYLRKQTQTEITQLAEKFPAEFALLSNQDDWDKVVKPCLSENVAKAVLTTKLDALEKVFKTYNDRAWRALVGQMHPSYVEAFNRDRLSRLRQEAGFSNKPWHLWQPAPGEKDNTPSNPYAGQEAHSPKYMR